MTRYIAIDWGSTNLRAWYYREGICQEERRSESGITRLNGRTPAEVFARVTEGWPVDDVPVVMAGMVGSNAGWLSVPYLPCPVALGDIASRLTRVDGLAWIVPGLSIDRRDNVNVMRGEETQLLGAHVLGTRPRESVSEFLSGLLIGHEVALMKETFMPGETAPITLIAGSSLADRYQQAMTFSGLSAHLLEGDTTFQYGIRSIADELVN